MGENNLKVTIERDKRRQRLAVIVKYVKQGKEGKGLNGYIRNRV